MKNPATCLFVLLSLSVYASAQDTVGCRCPYCAPPNPPAANPAVNVSADRVYVDLLTGGVYEIPKDRWTSGENEQVFHDVPLYDSPVLIVDRGLVPLM